MFSNIPAILSVNGLVNSHPVKNSAVHLKNIFSLYFQLNTLVYFNYFPSKAIKQFTRWSSTNHWHFSPI